MVGVLMGNKNVMNVIQGNVHVLENPQNPVAASCVGHKILVAIAKCKTGIVIVDNSGVTGPKYV